MMHIYNFKLYVRQRLCGVSVGLAAGRLSLCYGVVLVLAMLLSACLAPPIKPEAGTLHALNGILVVPVETPPLEILPDPIFERLPGIEHVADSLPLSRFVSARLYRNPGGVLIAGLLDKDDLVPEASLQTNSAQQQLITGLQPLATLRENWMPSRVIAEAAVAQLNAGKSRAALSNHYRQLPMADEDRSTYLGNWNSAVREWYNRDTSDIGYRRSDAKDFDAILEVGVADYKIFYGQTSLQILLKLIDAETGQVIGRSNATDYALQGAASDLLSNEAELFKTVIRSMGADLAANGLSEIGLDDDFLAHTGNPDNAAVVNRVQ